MFATVKLELHWKYLDAVSPPRLCLALFHSSQIVNHVLNRETIDVVTKQIIFSVLIVSYVITRSTMCVPTQEDRRRVTCEDLFEPKHEDFLSIAKCFCSTST